MGIWQFYPKSPKEDSLSVEKAASPFPEQPSIAVLSFANMSNDPEQAYFCDGIADKQAEEEFLNAIKIDPGHVDARLYLSLLYREWGEIQKASEQLRKVLEIDPTHSGARKFLKKIEQE